MGVEIFFQLLESGYEKFPHNTTACSVIPTKLTLNFLGSGGPSNAVFPKLERDSVLVEGLGGLHDRRCTLSLSGRNVRPQL